MQKGHQLEFQCQECQDPIVFSVFELDKSIHCHNCKKDYALTDKTLHRQLKIFEKLCATIQESEEILSNTSVGIDVGDQHIKVPYRLLLTRLSSSLDLIIDDKPVVITFRIEPSHDYPQ